MFTNSNRLYRILCIGEMWLGSNSRAAFLGLIRMGHSIQVIDEHLYSGATWRSNLARAARRLLRPLLVRELSQEAQRRADSFQPHALFVYKGNVVHPDLIRFFKRRGIPTVNYYPDVSFRTHGPYIPLTLPLYDHIFTSKSWGVADMQSQLGIQNISFLENGYDSELDGPCKLTGEERLLYSCDIVFIGTWSPKKEMLLAHLKRALPHAKLRIWGCQWEKARSSELTTSIVGNEIIGQAYSKVLQASSICLGFLSEARTGASSGDLITSRTFNIPGCGAFMLHERNEEVLKYFKDDSEAGFFASPDELVSKVQYYLLNSNIRSLVAEAGLKRCLQSGYSIECRMKDVVKWIDAHIATRD